MIINIMKKSKKTLHGDTDVNVEENVSGFEEDMTEDTSAEEQQPSGKKKKKKKKEKREKGTLAQRSIKAVVILTVIFSVMLIAVACVSNFINSRPDVKNTNSETSDLEPGIQFIPTGFVFDEEEDDTEKSALEGFIDFITGKNRKNNKNDDQKSDESDSEVKDSNESSPSESGNDTPKSDDEKDDTPDSLKDSSTTVKRKDEFYNFLLLAKDKGGGNTDTIMVVSFDVPGKSISLLQIPRDTSVNYRDSIRKINSVYSIGYRSVRGSEEEKVAGGIATLSTSLVQNFGIVIDRYVIIDLKGFREIVDTIGGVDVYVQQDMRYKDIYQDLDINLKKGMNHLDGEKAEQFVRFRKGYVNADLGRMDAQKIFMSAFLKKLFSISSVTKAPELIGHVMEYTVTDVTLQEATYFGTRLLDMDMSNITMHNLQGTSGSHTYYNGASYFSPYKNANIDLVNQYFNVFDKDLGPENVNPKMLVGEAGNGKYNGGNTAEEIENDNPDLMYAY